ncbi:MAG: hypothetical protein JW891_18190 [Candidatus Lokiarchaeota archaeon]|nr:hypothetical protein [Candidatus Lokiarchaeota archaeon]
MRRPRIAFYFYLTGLIFTLIVAIGTIFYSLSGLILLFISITFLPGTIYAYTERFFSSSTNQLNPNVAGYHNVPALYLVIAIYFGEKISY